MEAMSLPSITLIVYFIIEAIKYAVKNNEKFMRLIPLLAIVLGAVLGVVAFYVSPQIIPAADLFAAMVVGGASGISATGVNQIYKQLSKYKWEEDNNKSSHEK